MLAKKITGSKRHIAVDTLELIWAVVVHDASSQDQEGGHFVIHSLRHLSRLKVIFGDSAYGRERLSEWTRQTFGWILQSVLRPVKARGFVVLPNAGSWNARLPGWPATAPTPATMPT